LKIYISDKFSGEKVASFSLLMLFGGFVIPPLMGYIAGQMGSIGYARGFLVFIIISIICFGIIYLLYKNKKQKEKS